MLTKEERTAIAERASSARSGNNSLYWALFGCSVPDETTIKEDNIAFLERIIDLCDTSNMIELPLDKNGEVIRIHDVVYDNTEMEWEVREFRFPFDGACIYARTDDDYSVFRPDELTHKATTIEENIEKFNEDVKVTAQYVEASMNKCVEAMKKLAEVFNRLGDNND